VSAAAGRWYERILLGDVARTLERVRTLRAAGVIDVEPTPWQLCQGALRLWHRAIFRSDTVGTSPTGTVRATWRARVLANRAARLPALLATGAVVPHDLTGLRSSPAQVIRHLLGAHHDGRQFVFDLELIAGYGQLPALRDAVADLRRRDDAWARWLRDLTVFDGYHDELAAAVDAALAGQLAITEAEAVDPDLTLIGAMRWCAQQPTTPAASLAAWRAAVAP
jgi:hypothetical protein